MTYKEVEDYANEHDVQITLFNNPKYENSIVGISYDDRAIYDYEQMVQDLMTEDNISYEDAQEFIEYNALRALPYIDNSPIILYIKGDN